MSTNLLEILLELAGRCELRDPVAIISRDDSGFKLILSDGLGDKTRVSYASSVDEVLHFAIDRLKAYAAKKNSSPEPTCSE